MIRTSDFDYHLPEEKISAHPLSRRDESKLLVYKTGKIEDDQFRNIVDRFSPGDALVMNNTRVIKARLHFKKPTGKIFEIFCLEPANGEDPSVSLARHNNVEWVCLIKGVKRWGEADLSMSFTDDLGKEHEVIAKKLEQVQDGWKLSFSWEDGRLCFADILALSGAVPIPPYFKREAVEEDTYRYQTVYAAINGSVAAPTAGLHFTDSILAELKQKGVKVIEVTLHVGAGTFRPVKTDDATEHVMHEEIISVNRSALETLKDVKGRIIPVGTTSMRTLESLHGMAAKIMNNEAEWNHLGQWEYKEEKSHGIGRSKAIEAIIRKLDEDDLGQINGKTGVMITPGYSFPMCDALITNFHQPKSTLLLLISAFVGDDWKNIYDHALNNDYRFLSYGDSSLLIRN